MVPVTEMFEISMEGEIMRCLFSGWEDELSTEGVLVRLLVGELALSSLDDCFEVDTVVVLIDALVRVVFSYSFDVFSVASENEFESANFLRVFSFSVFFFYLFIDFYSSIFLELIVVFLLTKRQSKILSKY
jgi:hypothetical protein